MLNIDRGKKSIVSSRIFIATFSILLLGAIIIIYIAKNTRDVGICNGNEDNKLYANAARVLNPSANKKLKPIVDEIKQSKNFTSDANCTYLVLVYSINTSDAGNARLYFDIFAKNDSNKNLVKVLRSTQQSDTILKSQVEYLELSSKQSEVNDKAIGQPNKGNK